MKDLVPGLLTVPLYGLGAALLAVGAHSIFRVIVPPERLPEHHDVIGAIVSVIGVLYSVVLAFLVGTVWTSFDNAQQTADGEARYAGIAFEYAGGLAPVQRSLIQRLIARYAIEVRDVEWPVMALGRSDPRARALLNEAVRDMLAMPVHGTTSAQILKEEAIAAGTTTNLRQVGEDRVLRLVQSKQRLPAAVFEALILGAMLCIALTFLFSVKQWALQMTATAALAASIGLFFGLIVDLNAPYSGPLRVSPEAWTTVIDGGMRDALK